NRGHNHLSSFGRFANGICANHKINNLCLKQRLLLRVLQGDGRVTEINFDNTEEIQDINYCYVNGKNPISIYLLFDQYILISYVHANDTSDSTTYMDRGMVIYWNGKIMSIINFGPSYLFPNSTTWSPIEFFVNKMFPEEDLCVYLGCVERIILNGANMNNLNNFQITALQTLDSGYAIVYSDAINTQDSTNTTISTTTLTPVTTLPAQPTTTDNVAPNGNSANVRTLPLGGYALILQQSSGSTVFNFSLYNENNQLSDYKFPLNPIISNLIGAFDILQNNTMLVAQNETSTAWNLISIQLPLLSSYHAFPQKGSNNLTNNYNEINITFQDPVSFANGKLYIYQASSQSDILRQIINSKNCTQCTTRDNVVTLNVYDSTFNVPGGQYYIQIDNNFVKNSIYDEAILGINSHVWTFHTADINVSKQSGDIWGSLQLTTNGTQYFYKLSDSERSVFFTELINELTKGGEKLSCTQLANNLNQLITNGASTSISTGLRTKYLYPNYGFQQQA
ncbi:4974_t:CDS:10, partial [Racocetra persica]